VRPHAPKSNNIGECSAACVGCLLAKSWFAVSRNCFMTPEHAERWSASNKMNRCVIEFDSLAGLCTPDNVTLKLIVGGGT
jgi:hypothetical protein